MRNTIHVSADELHSRMRAAFTRAGLSPRAATDAADSLTEAECAGKSSHGLIRVEYVCTETARKKPGTVSIEKKEGCSLGINANRHMAYHPGVIGIEEGCAMAAESGVALVGIHNTSHSGMLGFFARRIAGKGYWGLVMAHCTALMAPHGGGRSVFGTNPIALGVPRVKRAPLIIDFSPAATTYGAVAVARSKARHIREGVALDGRGRPTTDPKAVMDGGTLLPAAEHKGSALALLVQLVCGPLIGASALPDSGTDYGLFFAIIRPDIFQDHAITEREVERVLAAVEDCPPMHGNARVRLPGEQSSRAIQDAKKNGLDVDRQLWEKAGVFAGLTAAQ